MAEQFASGVFKNISTGQEIDTKAHAPMTLKDLERQGFNVPINKNAVATPDVVPDITEETTNRRFTDKDTPKVDDVEAFNASLAKQRADIEAAQALKAQKEIAGIEDEFRIAVADENIAGEGRMGQTRSMSARGGLLGSDFGVSQLAKTQDFNKNEVDRIRAEKANAVAAVFDKFDKRAEARIASERELAFATREEQMANKAQFIQDAKNDIVAMASTGLTFDELDEEDVNEMMEQTGISNKLALKGYWNANMPTAQQIKYENFWRGDNLVTIGTDINGRMVSQDTYTAEELGIPVEDKPSDIQTFVDKISGETYWYDAENIQYGEDGSLIMKPLGIKGALPYEPKAAGGSTTTKLSTTQKTNLAKFFSTEEMDLIKNDVDKYGVKAVLENTQDEEAKKVIKEAWGFEEEKEKPKEYLTSDYVKSQFAGGLMEEAKKNIDRKDFDSFGDFGKEEDRKYQVALDAYVEDGINSINSQITALRKAGFTDEEIDDKL